MVEHSLPFSEVCNSWLQLIKGAGNGSFFNLQSNVFPLRNTCQSSDIKCCGPVINSCISAPRFNNAVYATTFRRLTASLTVTLATFWRVTSSRDRLTTRTSGATSQSRTKSSTFVTSVFRSDKRKMTWRRKELSREITVNRRMARRMTARVTQKSSKLTSQTKVQYDVKFMRDLRCFTQWILLAFGFCKCFLATLCHTLKAEDKLLRR